VVVDPDRVVSRFGCRIATSENGDFDYELDVENDQNGMFSILEIVYFPSGSRSPAVRSSVYRHRLPSESHRPQPPPRDDMKTFKFFLDLFVDDFGPYRNVYHALGGVYLVIGNLPLRLRQRIRNIFLLGFVPFGATFDDFIVPFVEEVHRMQDGIELDVDGEPHWIVAGMDVSAVFL
jgi:hypothetical protein